MLAARPHIRKALIARGWRTGVIGEVEMATVLYSTYWLNIAERSHALHR
jgi:hypothetical protein